MIISKSTVVVVQCTECGYWESIRMAELPNPVVLPKSKFVCVSEYLCSMCFGCAEITLNLREGK